MSRDRRIFGTAALLTGLLGASLATAEDVKPDEIASKMGGVVDSLGKKQTGDPVQGEQKAIVRDLDELIAQLEKQCQACKNGLKRNRPMNGMKDSTISRGTGGIGDLTDPNDGGKGWGKLSDRERDRILQSMSEGFPPEYRTVLERYYRRLAEEKSAKTAGEGAKSKAADEAAKP
ncbi:hypothetical protein [Aquisphaera insulae]|uniref:hypothetical protein n=1 Tax=Aquisphaera insulae TaxID=2712864 RepID=UPI0013EAE299|nr:hypothetical protein [Aquisphaera insulae]